MRKMMNCSTLPSLVQGLLLDLDGTLVNTEILHFASTNRVLEKHGHRLELEEFNSLIGWAEKPFWNKLRERYGIPEAISSLTKQRTHEFLDLLQNSAIEPLPGVLTLLERLQQLKIPRAVASNSPRDQIACIAESSGLSHHIPIWFSGLDDVKRGKPDPDVYIAAARALGLPPQRCVALEDSSSGASAARAAGAFVIAVPCASHLDPNLDAAHLKLTSLSELLPLIEPTLSSP
jgi:HAD superfamily hydrolase (TIGR01509 family)